LSSGCAIISIHEAAAWIDEVEDRITRGAAFERSAMNIDRYRLHIARDRRFIDIKRIKRAVQCRGIPAKAAFCINRCILQLASSDPFSFFFTLSLSLPLSLSLSFFFFLLSSSPPRDRVRWTGGLVILS